MAALSAEYLEILRRELGEHYVPHLPPLLGNQSPQQQAEKQTNRALSAFAMRMAFDVSIAVAAKCVVDDFQDNGIDAIFYDQKTETLHLVQSKLKSGEEFKQEEAQAFCSGVRLLFRQEFAEFNQNVLNRQTEIERAFSEASHIQLWVVYTGAGVSGAAKAVFRQLIEDDTHGEAERLVATVQYVDPEAITDELRKRNSYKPVNADVFLSNDVCIKEPRETWYGVANLKDLVDLHVKEENALYEKNVRYYLGSDKSDVNRGIQHTLIHEPESFFYLNNGITALCGDIAQKDRKANRRRLKVWGLSIINGAQTVASAAEMLKQPNPPDISNARVMLTLIKANSDGAFGSKVTKARNSQNVIQTADFAAQDPVQQRLIQELLGLGITYHVRPEANALSSANSILLAEAVTALSWLAEDPRFPVWLKSGKGDLFSVDSPAYKSLFTQSLAGAHLANAVFFYREIAKLMINADRGSVGKERLIYRHGLNAIGWSYIKRLRARIVAPAPMCAEQVPALISQSFDEHRQIAVDSFSAMATGPLAFFKNQTDTTPYLIRLLEQAFSLKDHAALPALKQPQINEAFKQERLFRFFSQQAPQI